MKSKIQKQLEELLETITEMLNENPTKAYIFLQYHLIQNPGLARILEKFWQTRKDWQKELKILMKGGQKFQKLIEPKIKELRKKEIKKLYKEMFADGM